MKLSHFLSLAALLGFPAAAQDDKESPADGDVAPKNNLRRAAAEKKTYIVGFNSATTGPKNRCNALAAAGGGSTVRSYQSVLNKGCALELTEAAASALKLNAQVASVEEDGVVTAADVQWGLDRVNDCDLPLDGVVTKQNAEGTKVFVLDTGIRTTHNNLKKDDETTMVSSSCSIDFMDEGGYDYDGRGHGTHVASTACGKDCGVAENCVLCAVKVLNRYGEGTWSAVIAGVDYVKTTCPNGGCVVNMSLGGGAYSQVDDAVNEAVEAGNIFVVAAMNWNANACNYSPARAAHAITVGSTTHTDARSSFSNYGTCLDIYAPGSSIKAAWSTSDTSYNINSGTSMASPHVAGLAAGILGSGVSPADVQTELEKAAASGKVSDAKTGSPNLLAVIDPAGDCPTPGPTPAPTPGPTSAPTPGPTPNCSNYTHKNCPNTCNVISPAKGKKCCSATDSCS